MEVLAEGLSLNSTLHDNCGLRWKGVRYVR